MNILSRQLQEGRMFAQLPQFRHKLSNADIDIRAMFSHASRSYVTLSWGKQSIIVAHMVFVIAPETPCVHWSNPKAEILADFMDTRDAFLERYHLNYTEFSEGDIDLKGNGRRYMQEEKLNGVFMGLAAEESKGRRYSLKQGSQTSMQYKDGTWRCCPLADWKVPDLAAYIAMYDLPLLRPYCRYGLDVRTSTGATIGSHSERALDFLNSTDRGDFIS